MLNKSEKIEKRVINEAMYITEKKATIRSTAKQFGVSKSTVHRDMIERLKGISNVLYSAATLVIKENKEDRHFRGGQSTKMKFRG